MRRSFLPFICGGIVLICVAVMLVVNKNGPAQDETIEDANGPRTLRVLFVGNSQFSVWDVPRMVHELSESAPAGPLAACL